ncbi:MAG TPA: Uma2 family endonuclease [Chthoniobacterales bacterium]|jgi:Uma2 family endonuclease|nr:Uma2 family endonuclease [Chthoniobacterales bacterium]
MATGTAARRFNVYEFHRLAEVGILGEDDRVELLDGQIMVMAPIGENHRTVVDLLAEFFTDQRNGRYRVAVQNPVRIDDENEPQPDIVLYDRSVIGRHPAPADVFLIVEVADTSLGYDQQSKIPVYASAGVKEVWIIDLASYCIQTYRDPHRASRHYAAVETYDRGWWVSPLAFPDVRARLNDLLR